MKIHFRKLSSWTWALGIAASFVLVAPSVARAQVPALVEAELIKMGRVVDPGCTGKLYRPLFGRNDYNAYWPVDAAMPNKTIRLYAGVTVTRDLSYGPQPKDLMDIFVPDKGGANRTVLIFIPGGAGNKIEQQSVESNMFYDNIGKWAADNGMVASPCSAVEPRPVKTCAVDRVAPGKCRQI
jgi:triacylglycerol lipase